MYGVVGELSSGLPIKTSMSHGRKIKSPKPSLFWQDKVALTSCCPVIHNLTTVLKGNSTLAITEVHTQQQSLHHARLLCTLLTTSIKAVAEPCPRTLLPKKVRRIIWEKKFECLLNISACDIWPVCTYRSPFEIRSKRGGRQG